MKIILPLTLSHNRGVKVSKNGSIFFEQFLRRPLKTLHLSFLELNKLSSISTPAPLTNTKCYKFNIFIKN